MFQPTTFGKYFLTRRIAVGGMAEVFQAKLYGADGFEKDIVIKQILPQHAKDPEFVQSFIAEAKIAVTLNHANIVGIYELGRVDKTYFIAMEFVDGLDAFSLTEASVRHSEPIGVGLALLVVEEVAKGLAYAHRKCQPDGTPLGLVHRDLNPRNVLISREGEVKILDFGIAKTSETMQAMPKTRAGVVKGTSGYMSPEQAMGKEIDARTDIYQGGLLLFELLSGQPLFWRSDDRETRDRMRRHHVIAPSQFNRHVPPEVDAIVFQALEREATRRIQTADELAHLVRDARYRLFPGVDHRELGLLVAKLIEREQALEDQQSLGLPSTARLREVIMETLAVETIAQREPSRPVHSQPVHNDPVYTHPAHEAAAGQPALHSTTYTESRQKGGAKPRLFWAILVLLGGSALASVLGFVWFKTDASAPTVSDNPSGSSPAQTRANFTNAWQPDTPQAKTAGQESALTQMADAAKEASGPAAPRTTPTPQRPTSKGTDSDRPNSDRPNSDHPNLEGSGSEARRAGSKTADADQRRTPSMVSLGTRGCSGRVLVDGRLVARALPAFNIAIEPGRHTIKFEGTECPRTEKPSSLGSAIPIVVKVITIQPGEHLKVVADFEEGTASTL